MNDSVQLIKFNYFFTIFDSYCKKFITLRIYNLYNLIHD